MPFNFLGVINMVFLILNNFEHEKIMFQDIQSILESEIVDNDIINDFGQYKAIEDIFGVDLEQLQNLIDLELLFNQNKAVFDLFMVFVVQMCYNYINKVIQDVLDDIKDDVPFYCATLDYVIFNYNDCICNYDDNKQSELIEKHKEAILKDLDFEMDFLELPDGLEVRFF